MIFYPCSVCPIGRYAARHPQSLLARCPGWKAYQRSLAAKAADASADENGPRQ
jgi:hypothetical protein